MSVETENDDTKHLCGLKRKDVKFTPKESKKDLFYLSDFCIDILLQVLFTLTSTLKQTPEEVLMDFPAQFPVKILQRTNLNQLQQSLNANVEFLTESRK